jgi:hypothetical protein
MKTTTRLILVLLVSFTTIYAQSPIPREITTPDKVETRTGTLDFKDGAPSKATVDKGYENLDFTHTFDAFNNTMRGVSVASIHKGLLSAGVKDNEVIVYSELMDAKSLFLTANADTVYFIGVLDLTRGPMVRNRNTSRDNPSLGRAVATIRTSGLFIDAPVCRPLVTSL